MLGDLDWLLNALRGLSASAEFFVLMKDSFFLNISNMENFCTGIM